MGGLTRKGGRQEHTCNRVAQQVRQGLWSALGSQCLPLHPPNISPLLSCQALSSRKHDMERTASITSATVPTLAAVAAAAAIAAIVICKADNSITSLHIQGFLLTLCTS